MSLLWFILFLACVDVFIQRGSTSVVQNKLTPSTNQFALTLYKEIGESAPGKNVILSPMSIFTALAMVYLGARGDTREEMASAMHFNVFNSTNNTVIGEEFQKLIQALNAYQNKYTLHIANGISREEIYRLKRQYIMETINYFNSILEGLDFDATRLVLTNAIYFQASWAYPFDEKYTIRQRFYSSSRKHASIKMMNIVNTFNYGYSSEMRCRVVEMGYAGGKFSMFIFVPKEIEGLSLLERRINAETLSKVFSSLSSQFVSLKLPNFVMDQSENLKDVLEKIGMGRMFEAGRADMSGIDGSRNLSVSDVVHKAFVEVNEKGTKADEATEIRMESMSAPIRTRYVAADRPFLFMIVEKSTGSILFLGRLTGPPTNLGDFSTSFPSTTKSQSIVVYDS